MQATLNKYIESCIIKENKMNSSFFETDSLITEIKSEYIDMSDLTRLDTLNGTSMVLSGTPLKLEQVMNRNESFLDDSDCDDMNESSSTPYTLNGKSVSVHTFRKTEWDIKKLENYVKLSFGDERAMELVEPGLLNQYLISFFKLAKKSDGMDYEPESLNGYMNSFERYFKAKNYPESLLNSDSFKESRDELKKKRELVRSIGKLIRTKNNDSLLEFYRDSLRDKGLLDRENPDSLLAEIYLNNMIYFGEFLKEDKAGRGNLNLVWGDVILETDPQNGTEYLTLVFNSKKNNTKKTINNDTKSDTGNAKSGIKMKALAASTSDNPVGLNDSNMPRVYAREPASSCPIEAYKLYRYRRPNNCLDHDSAFYLAPLFKANKRPKIWFKALAMSCQRLDTLFYYLFKKSELDLVLLGQYENSDPSQHVNVNTFADLGQHEHADSFEDLGQNEHADTSLSFDP